MDRIVFFLLGLFGSRGNFADSSHELELMSLTAMGKDTWPDYWLFFARMRGWIIKPIANLWNGGRACILRVWITCESNWNTTRSCHREDILALFSNFSSSSILNWVPSTLLIASGMVR